VPADLRAGAPACTRVELDWDASTDGGSGVRAYLVHREGALVAEVAAPATDLADAGVGPQATNGYAVAAVDQEGNVSATSATVRVTTPACPAPRPSPPSSTMRTPAAAAWSSTWRPPWGAEYAVATYLLVSSGRDLLGPAVGVLPEAWWLAYDVDLGDPAGGRYAWNALLRRDFGRGFVLVNQPEQPTRTVAFGGTYRTLDGSLRSSVTLGPAEGVVLLAP
jgi:hypothetical protein